MASAVAPPQLNDRERDYCTFKYGAMLCNSSFQNVLHVIHVYYKVICHISVNVTEIITVLKLFNAAVELMHSGECDGKIVMNGEE
jgi:hypothetical protein